MGHWTRIEGNKTTYVGSDIDKGKLELREALKKLLPRVKEEKIDNVVHAVNNLIANRRP